MPTYKVTDPHSGKTLSVTGDSPPTEGELYKLFAVDGGPETRAGGALASLGDTALKTGEGVAEGFTAPVLHPVETVKGLARTVMHPLDSAAGLGSFVKRAATEGLGPEEGGQAIGGLLGAKYLPEALPPIVKGLKRIPAGMAQAGGMMERAGPALNKIAPSTLRGIVGYGGGGPVGAAVAAATPRVVEGLGNLIRRGGEAIGGKVSPLAEGVDPYMPNTSSAPTAAGDFAASASDAPTIPQGTFTKLPDDSWGISGTNLEPGSQVHVMNRAGSGRMMTIDKILGESGGKQTATIRPADAPLPEPSLPPPSTPPGPTGSGVRSFLESELRGNDRLGDSWDQRGFGPEDYPGRGVPQAGQGMESYAGTAAGPALPRSPSNLTPAQMGLLKQLWASAPR